MNDIFNKILDILPRPVQFHTALTENSLDIHIDTWYKMEDPSYEKNRYHVTQKLEALCIDFSGNTQIRITAQGIDISLFYNEPQN